VFICRPAFIKFLLETNNHFCFTVQCTSAFSINASITHRPRSSAHDQLIPSLCSQIERNIRLNKIKTVLLFFLFSWGWVRLSLLDTSATNWPVYQPRMIDDDECGAVGGMRIGRGNRSTRRKPVPAPLCSPQIPHDLTRARTRAALVKSLIYVTVLKLN
jgi:hypothetical protein